MADYYATAAYPADSITVHQAETKIRNEHPSWDILNGHDYDRVVLVSIGDRLTVAAERHDPELVRAQVAELLPPIPGCGAPVVLSLTGLPDLRLLADDLTDAEIDARIAKARSIKQFPE